MLPTRDQWRRWSLPAKYSALSLAISIIAVAITLVPEWMQNRAVARSTHERFVGAALELRHNCNALQSFAHAGFERTETTPVLQLRTERLMAVVDRDYAAVTRESRGEEKTLYGDVLIFDAAARMLAPAITRSGLEAVEWEFGLTIHDMVFLACFLDWYIRLSIVDFLPERAAMTVMMPPPRSGLDATWIGPLRMRHFMHDGTPLSEFLDYLALID